MNLRQLKYFVGVVEAGNMTRAAEQLHIAQTALGMQIRQLEEDLGVCLLVRHSRGIEPTRAGSLLHARALTILKMVDETTKEVAAYDRDASETIRIGMPPAVMLLVGTELAVTVREHHPQVFLSLVEEMSHVLIETLSRGELDFILCWDVPDLPHLVRTALLQDDLVLVTLPGQHKGEPIAFVDALEGSLVMAEEGDSVRNAVLRTTRELGLELKIAYEVRSMPAMKNLVARGVAHTILPFASVIDEVRSGMLDAHPITMPAVRRTLFLASSSQRPQFRSEAGFNAAVRTALKCFMDAIGPLAQPLWVRTA